MYTFVINTYPGQNRDVELIRCLNSIFAQSMQDFNVLLIENHSDSNKLMPLIRSGFASQEERVTVLVDPTKKLSHLFDIGWRAADTDMIAYVADDVELETDWLRNAHDELVSSAEIGVVTGPVLSECFPAGEMHRLYLESQRNFFTKFFSWPYLHFAFEDKPLLPGNLFESGAYSLGAAIPDAVNFSRQEIDLATTSSMVIKRSVLEEVRGFDKEFNFNHADGDLFIRIKKSGYKIIFSPKVIAHHHLRLGPSRNAYIIGYDTATFYKKHISPKTFNGRLGAVMNIMFLNIYWIYSFIRTRDLNQLNGISGFIKSYTKKRSFTV